MSKTSLLFAIFSILLISCENSRYENYIIEGKDTLAVVKVFDEKKFDVMQAGIAINKKYAKNKSDILAFCRKLLKAKECRYIDEVYRREFTAETSVYIVDSFNESWELLKTKECDYTYQDFGYDDILGRQLESLEYQKYEENIENKAFQFGNSFKMDGLSVVVVDKKEHFTCLLTPKRLNRFQLWRLGCDMQTDMVYFFDHRLSEYRSGEDDYACVSTAGANTYLMLFDEDKTYTLKEISMLKGYEDYVPHYAH